MSFVHLHVHSEFSLLDGLSRIPHLVAEAKALGQPAIALTDHGVMYGVIDFYRAAKAEGVKPIIGIEAYLSDCPMEERNPRRFHLLLLAENQTGYQNLLRLASDAQLEGFYYKPRIDHERLARYSEGLIVTSGCMASEIPRLIGEGQAEKAKQQLGWYLDVFGRDRFFLELQEHNIPELTAINKTLLEWGPHYQLRYVATNDVHYVRREDAKPHDLLLCIQTGKVVNQPDRMRMSDPSYYLKSRAEMAQLFGEVPGALDNTLLVAERCNVNLDTREYHLPRFDVPQGYDAKSYLRHLCEKGLRMRYGDHTDDPVVRERLEHELNIIHTMGFDAYFLIVWDLCMAARERDIWWNVRGSAAGSIVAYSLEITMVDPLATGLIFERFLNPGRVSMPDIDLDFPDDRRRELIEYTVQKYGQDQVAQIITFGTMGARAAVRDVGRAMDVPLPEVDRIAKMIPSIPGKPVSISQAIKQVPELRAAAKTDYIRELLENAASLEGVARHASTHAAGVIISDKPLVEYCPLHRPTKGSGDTGIGVMTQWPMEIVESIGLLKVDFLGLSTLTVMRRACDLIQERHGVEYNLDNIPLEDPKAFELLASGDVMGVFQVEGSGFRRVLAEMRPSKYEHIVAVLALYRPGPMEYIPDYIRRMHGEESVEYRHPRLQSILEETYGITVYQEQIMHTAMQLGNYSASEADFLRKCISEDMRLVNADTGERVKIKDVTPGTKILSLNEHYRLEEVHVAEKFYNGVQSVYAIRTRSGRYIELTAHHPLCTLEGWQYLSDLEVGDEIAVPIAVSAFGADEPPEEQVKVLTYLLGDGQCISCDGYPTARFYNSDSDILEDFIGAVTSLGAETSTYSHPTTRVKTITTRGPNGAFNPIVQLVRSHNLAHRSYEKKIPLEVYKYSRERLCLFIGILWSTDGSIEKDAISYSSSSKELILGLQHLLRRFGINCWLGERTTTHRNNYKLIVRDQGEITRFGAAFGQYLAPVKVRRLVSLLEKTQNKRQRYSRYRIPAPVLTYVKQAKVEASITWREAGERVGLSGGNLSGGLNLQAATAALSRPRLARLAKAFDSNHLRDLAHSDVLWDSIISIEYVGEKRVYDLAVPPHANFVVEDTIVHNSVAKKKGKELLKQRDRFVSGAVENDIPEDTANAIFNDWEAFARYGFPKGHAADYAVITCQTAYLKAHYPVEYMTALMTVERHNTDKIGLLVAECRKMDIEVLPPDVNASDIDFSIKDDEDAQAIRFGLGAIKNVGEGPVQTILQARREAGLFENLDDFCRRVDLRQVNRRALESIIKVGALRPFGIRSQLLAAAEHLVGHSASIHKAKDVGQMSLFGAATGLTFSAEQAILGALPETPEVPRKEILGWEKDLIGTYVSEHPLQSVIANLQNTITHFSGDLDDSLNGKMVTLAGMVNYVRRHTTKKGAPMAFVGLEDLQGLVEIVVFPRIWKKTQEKWQADKIVIVRGRVDAKGREPKILCESVSDQVRVVKIPGDGTPPSQSDHSRRNSSQARRAPARPLPSSQPSQAEISSPRPPRPAAHLPRRAAPGIPVPAGQSRPQELVVTIRRSGDHQTDVEQLRLLHELLTEFTGDDRFKFHLIGGEHSNALPDHPTEPGHGNLELAFPNDRTCYCPELTQELVSMLGPDCYQLE